jgi:hypothetical protein
LLRELGFYGVLVSPLLAWMCIALPVTALLRRGLGVLGLYRYVWHRPLFDTALLVIVLGSVAGLSAWLQVL